MQNNKKSIGVVGGGILGMTLALFLSEKGFRVSLLEKASKLGGLVSPWKIDDYTWDQFYHVILLSDRHLIELLDSLGLADQINWGYTKTGFFTDGKFHSMSNIKEFIAFPPLNLVDKLRLGFTIYYASKIKSFEQLEKISCVDWLKKLSGKRTVEKIWLPLLRSKLGENYRFTSASFIWTAIARMYAARRSGIKQEMFGYVNGGYASIIDRFQTHLNNVGIETHLESTLTKITQNDSRVVVETAEGASWKFDEVILTVPCPQIAKLCPQLSSSEKQRLRKVVYLGLICPSLILKRPLGGYYYTNITDEGIPFTSVIEMTALANRDYFGGNSLVYLPRYMTEDDPFWQKSDEEIREEFLKALEFMYPTLRKEDLLLFKMSKIRDIMPLITLNYSMELLPSTRTSLKHVFVVNSAQIVDGTWNVNEAIRLAKRKAAEIADLLSNKGTRLKAQGSTACLRLEERFALGRTRP
jgi:protoporphyrinogen oxidase